MSKTCVKQGRGSTMLELDIYRDMNLNIDQDCPAGWSEGTSHKNCPDDTTVNHKCYKCDGNMRQVVEHCVPSDVSFECPEGFDEHPIKCNFPSMDDVGPQRPKSYDVHYCACQEYDGTVTGYSPLCCPKEIPSTESISPMEPKIAGVGNIPWFAWLLVAGGLIYFFKTQDKKILNK